MKLQTYKDSIVWQKSMQLVKSIYDITSHHPSNEQFGISSQIQRAAVAIPSNIAEGYGRQHRKEFLQFISIARGSSCELETQLLICREVKKLNNERIDESLRLLEEVQKMLRSLTLSLQRKSI